MTLFSGGVIFILSWWMVLFTVLPIGVQGQYEDGDIIEGSEPGAPTQHGLRKKLIWATIGAAVITLLAAIVISTGVFTPERPEWG